MSSVAFGAAALIVLRSFVKAARCSFGAEAMYSSAVFAGAVIADERFVGAAFFFASFAVAFRVGTHGCYGRLRRSSSRRSRFVGRPAPRSRTNTGGSRLTTGTGGLWSMRHFAAADVPTRF